MFVFARRTLSFAALGFLIACSGPTSGATPTAPALQAQSFDAVGAALDAAPEVGGGRALFTKLRMHPDAGAPLIMINFVSNGPAQGGVPCIACVSGAQTNDNVGLTGPSSYVPAGATWQYALSFTDVKYKGKCTLAWTITSGAKTIDSFATTLNLTSYGGFVLYAINRARPAYHGGATLTGRVTCGKSKPALQAPLYFQ